MTNFLCYSFNLIDLIICKYLSQPQDIFKIISDEADQLLCSFSPLRLFYTFFKSTSLLAPASESLDKCNIGSSLDFPVRYKIQCRVPNLCQCYGNLANISNLCLQMQGTEGITDYAQCICRRIRYQSPP